MSIKISYLKRCICIVLFIIYSSNSFAQSPPNFQAPTDYQHYVGYYGEERPGRRTPHQGLDIVGQTGGVINGADVRASAGGTVRRTEDWDGSRRASAGNYVVVDHGNGWVTRYMHLQDYTVEEGQQVSAGDVIGHVGRTGTNGPHLHFETRHNGEAVDPLDYLPEDYTCRSRTGCPQPRTTPPPTTATPGGGHPDDTFAVADETFTIDSIDLEHSYYSLAVKKNKTFVGNYYTFKKLIRERDTYLESLPDGSIPDQNYLDSLEVIIAQLYESFGTEQESFWQEYEIVPDLAVLQNGYIDESNAILNKFFEPTKETALSFSPSEINNQKVLAIPSGGLYGMENSAFFKASLNEYVKQGGTLIVFAQQHGYEFSALPTPDGKPITGYGWEEDQNCFANAVYINAWHQVLAGQTKASMDVSVDGYFTQYPQDSTVLLKRTANGQPAMLLYQYGQGNVLITSLYEDFASSQSQSTQAGKTLIRDISTWAKSPSILPEIKPGETANTTVILENNTSTDAASAILLFYDPSRMNPAVTATVAVTLHAGQKTEIPYSYSTTTNSPLGIWHVDYLLYDNAGNVISKNVTFDASRFVVSSPPQTGPTEKPIWFSVSTLNWQVFYGEPFTYTFHVFNNTATTRNLKIKAWLPHTNRWHEWSITATANGETTVTGSDLFLDTRWMYETLRAFLYDENGTEIGNYMLSLIC